MMGTLAMVLAGSKIRTFKDRFKATVTGDIEDVDGTLKITHIKVHYHLKAEKEKHVAARQALENYLHLCPGAQSVIDCIDIRHRLTLENIPDFSK